jgi:hypothetical protein
MAAQLAAQVCKYGKNKDLRCFKQRGNKRRVRETAHRGLDNFYSPPHTIRAIGWEMVGGGHTARMGDWKCTQNAGGLLEARVTDRKEGTGILSPHRGQWRSLVNTVNNWWYLLLEHAAAWPGGKLPTFRKEHTAVSMASSGCVLCHFL